VSEFYELSPTEFFEALIDQQSREQTGLEIQTRAIWESTRINMMHQYNMNPYRKKSLKDPKELFKLPWEIEKDPEPQTVNQMKAMLKAIYIGSKNRKGKVKM
jgi:hypothetical protein